MKVTCQYCQAKYSIADEKVRGKIAKIRCKKCGTTIIVNGTAIDAEAPATASVPPPQGQVADYAQGSTDEQWTVLVADDDQRTLTAAQAAELYVGGAINLETLVWKDGMTDWLPVAQVEALRATLEAALAPGASDSEDAATSIYNTEASANEQHAPAPAAGRPAAAAKAPAAAALHPAHEAHPAAALHPAHEAHPAAALHPAAAQHVAREAHAEDAHRPAAAVRPATAAKPAAAVQPAAAAARTEPRRPGRGAADLFGGAAAGDDVLTSASSNPSAAPVVDKPTGARNENSVLFSLSSLTGGPGPSFAAEEASSAADLKSLSSAGTGNGKSGAKNKLDDIINLGAGGLYNQALVAPALAPPPVEAGPAADSDETREEKKKNKMILVYAAAGVLVLAGGIALGISLGGGKKDGATGPQGTASAAAPAQSLAMAQPTPAAPDTVAAPAAHPSAAAPAETPTALAPGATVPKPVEKKEPPAGAAAAEKPAPTAAAPKPTSALGAIAEAVKPPPTAAAPAAPAAAPGAGFDRAAASSALSAIGSAVQSCKKPDGPTGAGRVKVTFATSGNVTTVVIDGPPFAGTSTGGCIMGKFRGAHVPPFSGDSVTAGKSFQIN
jgi:predicted Zn finger-like uncharacterized protein